MRITRSITIESDPEGIWPYLTDPAQIPRWTTGVVFCEKTGPDTVRLGIREGARVVAYESRATTADEPNHLAVTITGGSMPGSVLLVDYRLLGLGGQTQLDYECDARFAGLVPRLLSPLIGLFLKLQARRFLKNLKRLVEAEAGRGSVTSP